MFYQLPQINQNVHASGEPVANLIEIIYNKKLSVFYSWQYGIACQHYDTAAKTVYYLRLRTPGNIPIESEGHLQVVDELITKRSNTRFYQCGASALTILQPTIEEFEKQVMDRMVTAGVFRQPLPELQVETSKQKLFI